MGLSIELSNNCSNVLVIENHKEFERFLLRLIEQIKDVSNYFYTDEEKMTLFRRISIITSPLDLQISDRDVQKKLYAHLIEEIDNSSIINQLVEVHSKIVQSFEELSIYCDFEIDYSEEFSINTIFKNMNIRLKSLEGNFCEKLISFGDIVHKLLGKDFIVLYNCDAYLSPKDYDNLDKWANYNDITLLFIRNHQFIYPKERNEYIIDNDLCEIH